MRTLQEAARDTGIPYQTLKKHAQRGKLRTGHDSAGRITVEDEDLEAYQLSEAMAAAAKETTGQPLEVVARDLGNVFAQLPQQLKDAVLAGIPTQKSAGGSAAYREVKEGFPRHGTTVLETADPHCGFPVGYQHKSSPRWKRISASTWQLGDRTYSWNGFGWEPGGNARDIDADISPASPFADLRPLASSHAVKEPK